MTACANTKCVAFGRIVYSLATRCPLCKWDLKGILPVSEVGTPPKPDRHQTTAARRSPRTPLLPDILIPQVRMLANEIAHQLNALRIAKN